MSTLTIGQVAERTGFTASTLRYYEGLGLCNADDTDEGRVPAVRRRHGESLAFIARAKQLGCSLDEISDLLAIWDGDCCAPVQRRFHELVTEKIGASQAQIAELTPSLRSFRPLPCVWVAPRLTDHATTNVRASRALTMRRHRRLRLRY